MKNKSQLIRRVVVVVSIVGLFGLAPRFTWAIPSLQLYIDPDDNIGTGYDNATETWVYQGANPEFKLEAFALDKQLGSPSGDAFQGTSTRAQLAIALRGSSLSDAGIDPSTLGTIEIDGAVIGSWRFGVPIGTPVPGGNLPPHGIFPTWYATYSFDFGTFGAPVFNAVPPVESIVTEPGWHKIFNINYAGLNQSLVGSVHFDVFTVSNQMVYSHNPFGHDAEAKTPSTPPVPEPATLFLLGAGLVGFALRRKTGVDFSA